MALVFHECKADYQVLFYRQSGSTFERFGPQFTLLDFDQPRLDTQGTPAVRTRHRPTGDRQFFKVAGNDIQLLAESGDWQPVASGVGARAVAPEKR